MLITKLVAAITFSLLLVVHGNWERHFSFRWYNGTDEILAFKYHSAGECLYDTTDDFLVCVANYPFASISSSWLIYPQNISYIFVSCREQSTVSSNPSKCICKLGAHSASKGSLQKTDRFELCQITELSPGTLNHLNSLEALDLSYNSMKTIQNGILSGLRNLKYISLANNPITFLPEGFFCDLDKLHYIDLQHMNFSMLPSAAFHCFNETPPVHYLDLSKNKIHNLFPNELRMLPSLIFVNLSDNAITNIHSDAFYNTISLTALDLSGNSLRELPPRLCQRLRNVLNLYISGNHILVLHALPLINCTRLQLLDLSSNIINHIPQGINLTSLQFLSLSENDLIALRPSMFSALPVLLDLDLSVNKIKLIEPGTFLKMSSLKFLNLSRNQLEDGLNFNRVFMHLEHLVSLDLRLNLLTFLGNESFALLENLKFLDLSYNYISFFNPSVFKKLSTLKILKLRANKISLLPTGAFKDLTNLEELDISENDITTIQHNVFPQNPFILNLYQNSLQIVPVGLRNTSIIQLDLGWNNIRKLPFRAFYGMSKLVELDLSHNRIREIFPRAFISLANLRNLSLEHNELSIDFKENVFEGPDFFDSLNLAFNKIHHLTDIFRYYPLQRVKYLNMSNNPIKLIHDSLSPLYHAKCDVHVLFLDNCNITEIVHYAFNHLDNLKTIYLRNNSLSHLKPFVTGQEITVLLHGNPLICSCDMRWLKKRDLMFGTKKLPKSVYQVDDCTFVQNSNRKTIINANINEFLCISKTSCDPKCNCFTDKETGMPLKTICTRKLSVLPTSIAPSTRQLYLDGNNFESLGELDSLSNRNGMLTKEIYLNSSRITSVSENVVRRFSHLIILHLDENLIKTLPQYVFGNLVLLKELYLQNNQIMFFADNVFHGLRSLKHLDLSGNKLKVIEPHTLTALSNMQMLRSVQLEKNPWQCSCENQQFYNWLNYNYSMVRNRRDIRCHGKIILEQHPSTFKCEPSVTKKIVVVSMILSIIVLALLLTFLVRYRRECVALLYVKLSLSWCRKKGKSYKPFDAYLIHDDLDDHCHKWLESTFLPRLENGKTAFKIFIPNRDNASATRRPSIGVSPIDTLKQCRCTIMIVSRDTSSNCFCTSALQAAITWSSKDPSHRVILVFYGNVDISTLDDDIKRKVQNRDYLTARGRCFWYRLEYELPKPSPNGQEIHEHEAHVEEDTAIIRNSILFDNTSYI